MVDDLKSTLRDAYRAHILEEGEPPVSVYRFCRHLEIEEKVFFEHFSSLEALEASIWEEWSAQARHAIETDADSDSAGAMQLHLTYLYTFIDILQSNRSFLLLRWPRNTGPVCPRLRGLRRDFDLLASQILQKGRETNEIRCPRQLDSALSSALATHLIWVVEFYCDDDSDGFERTDAFIEKSVRLFFELAGGSAIASGIDLARFLAGCRK